MFFKQSYGVVTILQVIIAMLSATAAASNLRSWSSIYYYYGSQPVIIFGVSFSITYIGSDLAKRIPHAELKVFFYILNLASFILQLVIMRISDGFDKQCGLSHGGRFGILAGLMCFVACLMFIGFIGKKAPPKKDHHPEEQKIEVKEEETSEEEDD